MYYNQTRQDVMPEESSYQIKELIPQTKFISIERCGHFPDMENPKAFYPALKKAFSANWLQTTEQTQKLLSAESAL